MIPKKVLKAIGKVLKHNGNHVDHHLRNLMQEIETHLAQNPLEENKDATTGKVQHSTVRSNQDDKLPSSSSNATTTGSDPVNKTMSSSDDTTSSVAKTETQPPPSDVAREKERAESNRVRKGRYIESEEEEDSTDSNEGDALDGDDYIDESNNVYMGGRAKRKAAPLSIGANRVKIPRKDAEEGISEEHNEQEHCGMCLSKLRGTVWLTNCGHLLCSYCQARLLTLASGSRHRCQDCHYIVWEATPIDGHTLERYQGGCRMNRRRAANSMEEGQYAV